MYKAILQKKPKFKFTVEQITDEDGKGMTSTTYSFLHMEPYSSGTFAVRKTKQGAINAIKNSFKSEIRDCEKKIVELNRLIEKIKV